MIHANWIAAAISSSSSLMLAFAQEGADTLIRSPSAAGAEGVIANVVQWLKLIVETIGALIIGMGVAIASYQFFRALIPPRIESYNSIRLTLARYLALALEFQLGADILTTAIAPGWTQIGKLGAIAVIRTALNYFLTREMKDEREGIASDTGGAPQERV